MPCSHKFRQYLSLERIDFIPTTLIVGTFNPDIGGYNTASWFYGRTNNNTFWNVLPRIYGGDSLLHSPPVDWMQFCSQRSIAITDLISGIEDADLNNQQHLSLLRSYSDDSIAKAFQEHTFVSITELLQKLPSIVNVYLTRGASGFWADRWQPVSNYCIANNIRCTTLLTPSGNARYQLGRYNNANPNQKLSLEDYVLMRWQEQWHNV